MNILDQIVPGLSAKLDQLSPDQWRPILVKACQESSRSVGDIEPSIQALFETAARNNALTSEELAQVRVYAEESDKRYFDAQDAGEQEGVWGVWFAKARLATALANAFGNGKWDSAENAFYEVLHVNRDNPEIPRLIETELRAILPPGADSPKGTGQKWFARFRRK